jgi:hypothetical protein
MRRLTLTITTAIAIAVFGGAASAQAASPQASCVGVITSYEGSELPPASVGHEVSGLATSAPGLGAALVSPLAHRHLGSLETCAQSEG